MRDNRTRIRQRRVHCRPERTHASIDENRRRRGPSAGGVPCACRRELLPLTRPVRGATLIGNGPDVLRRVSMVGNDLKLDEGVGTCGKEGQDVPVGVGQPTLRIDGLTVGGTATE